MITYQYIKNKNAKTTILLIHGWNTSSLYMESFIQPLKNNFSILLVDLFKNLDKAYTIDDFIEEIYQIVSSLNILNLVIVGHSFGGKIGYFYQKKYSLDGLVLIAPSLIKPKFNLKTFLKIKLYKYLKKKNKKIPKFLKGSKDYQNSSGHLNNTFKNCVNCYMNQLDVETPQTLVYGFKNDREVKVYQIKKISKYIKNSKIKIFNGNHFAYLDHIKEITLDIYGIYS